MADWQCHLLGARDNCLAAREAFHIFDIKCRDTGSKIRKEV